MNKLYEGMFLFDANYAGKDWPGLEQHVQDLFQRHAAELVHAERWPDRKLAYEIKGCKKGTYYLTYFNAPTTAIQGLQRDCGLSDRVLRAMFVYEDALAEDCEKLKSREAEKLKSREAAEAEKDAPPEPIVLDPEEVTHLDTPDLTEEPEETARETTIAESEAAGSEPE